MSKPRKAVFCDQCVNFIFSDNFEELICRKLHKPYFSMGKGDPRQSGYKRRCEDFKEGKNE